MLQNQFLISLHKVVLQNQFIISIYSHFHISIRFINLSCFNINKFHSLKQLLAALHIKNVSKQIQWKLDNSPPHSKVQYIYISNSRRSRRASVVILSVRITFPILGRASVVIIKTLTHTNTSHISTNVRGADLVRISVHSQYTLCH